MTLLRMLRAFTRDSQEENNTPTVDPQFSDVHWSVAAIIPLRDKHPENNEHKAPIIRPGAELVRAAIIPRGLTSGAGSTCVR